MHPPPGGGSGCIIGCEEPFSGLLMSCFLYINPHVSWHPHQLDPFMFCQFHQGLMAVQTNLEFTWKMSSGLDSCQKECRCSCV